MHLGIRSLRGGWGRVALLPLLVLIGACAQPDGPEPFRGVITRVVMVIRDEAGVDRTWFVDPRIVDAVFLSEDVRDQFYEGAGVDALRPIGPDDLSRRPLGPLSGESPGGRHIKSPPPYYCVYVEDAIRRVGVYIQGADGRSQLWWVNPGRVGAVFLSGAARDQFYGGVPAEVNQATDPPTSLYPDSADVPVVPGGASLHLL